MSDSICQCPKCGRLHRHLAAGTPPRQIAQRLEEISTIFPAKAFWCLQPLLSREIDAVSRRARAVQGEDHSEYLRQLEQCLGAVSTASRQFLTDCGQMIAVTEALRCDEEAAP